MPPVSKVVAVPLVILFVVLGISVVWLMLRNPVRGVIWLVVLLGIPMGLVNYFYFNRRHCPECGAHLLEHRKFYEGTTRRYRVLLDCDHCQIAWDTGCDVQIGRYG